MKTMKSAIILFIISLLFVNCSRENSLDDENSNKLNHNQMYFNDIKLIFDIANKATFLNTDSYQEKNRKIFLSTFKNYI